MNKSTIEMIQDFINQNNLKFFSCDGSAYVSTSLKRNQVISLDSEAFTLLLQELYSSKEGDFMSPRQVDNLKTHAKILARKNKENLSIRIGHDASHTWLNLNENVTIKISSFGWKTITDSSFAFWKDDSSLDLPLPSSDGDIWDIKKIVKLNNDFE